MELVFEKYEGLGNDFIVCEAPDPTWLSPAQAIRLCDRHFGLGADGVLLVSPPTDGGGAWARMTVLNADGSRPEMCGNGLRCVALHLVRTRGAQAASSLTVSGEVAFEVETDAGARGCSVLVDGPLAQVTTDMGRGVEQEPEHAELGSRTFDFVRVSMGNPHAICFTERLAAPQLDVLGPAVSGRFAEGSNVEIATVESPTRIVVDVWERGVGRTLACGTGAAATAVAAARAGHSPYEQPITVQLPGGPLAITVARDLRVSLRGPARWVFSGRTVL